LIDLRRVLTFLSRPRALGSHIYDADIRELSEDVRSLVEHDAFLFQKVRFLLDTTSGFINTEQNDTIRRFSILPSMLAPPMLIASIYGMNTEVLPFAHGSLSFWIVASILMAFQIGIQCSQLNTKQLGELYYNAYNPDTAVREPLGDFTNNVTTYVRKAPSQNTNPQGVGNG
jgi:Mg2+ and Co2+ transporter CorA